MVVEKIREGLYIKKDRFGYRVIYPIKREDGTTNWFNLLTGGSWWKLIKVVVVVFLILGMCYSYYHDTKACRELQENICDYLPNISAYCTPTTSFLSPINFTLNKEVEDEKSE